MYQVVICVVTLWVQEGHKVEGLYSEEGYTYSVQFSACDGETDTSDDGGHLKHIYKEAYSRGSYCGGVYTGEAYNLAGRGTARIVIKSWLQKRN